MIIHPRIHAFQLSSVVCVCVLALCACAPSTPIPKEPPHPIEKPVPSASMTIATDEQHIQVVLSWEDLQPQTIAAPNAGKIDNLLIQEGQHVQGGQRLIQLKTEAKTQTQTTIKSTVDQAAKAQAYQKWQQDKDLHAQGFISQAAVAKSAAAYHAASQSQSVVQHTPNITQAATSTWLQAPFNGVIRPLAISHGAQVKNGQKLFVIEPDDTQRIKILVAQDNHQELFIGQRLYLYEPKMQQALWLQISELPPITDKQYVLAYALWPQDLPKPAHFESYQAYLVTHQKPLP